MKKSIGIDLGTTNSVVAVKKVSTEVLKNAEGEYITPSCVMVKKRLMRKPEFIVGRDALEWLRQEPEHTITAVKRLIGRNFHEKEVQELISKESLHYQLSTHSHGSANSLAILINGKEFTPEEISAKILAKLKADAEAALGDEVDAAVITVPAYFNDKQKHATRTAAALAGLKVRRLLPEPTAAAISFGVDKISGDDGRTVLVFDFGGGTLDLSILTISGGRIIEMGKGGDMWLGGEDIDQLLIEYVLQETAREEGLADIQDIRALIEEQKPSRRNKFLAELKTAVEKAKIVLSDKKEAYIEILGVLQDKDGDPLDVEVELPRTRFESMMVPLLRSMLELVRGVIADVHFTEDLIDNVLLVGGSSRIPCVIQTLQEEFGQEKVLLHERPMLAVAEGAAILSHRLADTVECPQCTRNTAQNAATCSHCGFDLEGHTVEHGVVEIVHAAAHDYYIKLENDQRFLMVEKNTPLPCSSTEVFQLVDAEQELVHMKFYNVVNRREQSIGDLWLGIDQDRDQDRDQDSEQGRGAGKAENLEKSLKAQMPARIEITLDIDENNLISVNAALLNHPEVAVSRTLSRGKADERLFLELEQAIATAEKEQYSSYTVIDLQNRARSIVKSINGVVDPKKGTVDEKLYEQVAQQIHKAIRIAANEEAPLTQLYYAESMLDDYAVMIEPKVQDLLRERIEKLRQIDATGSYEETMRASAALAAALDDKRLAQVNTLMQIENASEICFKTDPSKAKKFMRVIAEALEAAEKQDGSVADKLNAILPEVDEVLENYAMSTQKIHRDIRK
ncbi:MAG: Hsp70 family protein [Candidatus Electrothrix aestuarii]|uniref:Hsp70 family protein n=1 Tax=Candidatus Electrothrix aestuarii TaxID=3062594 RepID=A0AAU8M2H3_9BACT|nr:Hsp70 family protein [Candidatus Electrothrix aestuarii]